jgi:hypothetical protein
MRNLSNISAAKFAHVQGIVALAVDEKVQININTWKIDRVKAPPQKKKRIRHKRTLAHIDLTSLTMQALLTGTI